MNKTEYNTKDDVQALALAAKKGDQESKALLCEKFKGLIYSLSKTAYETLDAKDVRQDLWVYFLEYVNAYDEAQGGSFLSYITSRMKWRICDCCRIHERKLEHEIQAASSDSVELIVSGELAVDGITPNWYEIDPACGEKTDVETLIQAIPGTEKQKELLRLRMQGLSWHEVAKKKGISDSAVYKQIRSVQKALLKDSARFEEIFA